MNMEATLLHFFCTIVRTAATWQVDDWWTAITIHITWVPLVFGTDSDATVPSGGVDWGIRSLRCCLL